MNWFLWTLVVLYVVSTALTVASVGKPRKPLEPGTAAFVVIVNALIVAGIFLLGAN